MATIDRSILMSLAVLVGVVSCGSGSSGKGALSSAGASASGAADSPGDTGDAGRNGVAGSSATGNGAGGSYTPPTTTKRSPPGSCGIADPAFCEEFTTPDPGGPSGDLDEKRWSFARWGHETRQAFVRNPVSTIPGTMPEPAALCGKPFSNVPLEQDVAICDGIGVDGLVSAQLNEVYDDQGDFAINSNRARQLFDFTDRTGTIMFDVDAKVNPCNLGHGWWIELWVTKEPGPIPYHEAPGVLSYPENGFGINFQGLNTCPQGRNATEVASVFVSKDWKVLHSYPGWELQHDSDADRCITVQDQKLNRFKILINKDQVEIWASNFDDPTNLHRLAVAKNLDLPFTRGYVHFQHSAYNARKDYCENQTTTGVQTYRWDNIGFDGPSYPNPRGYPTANNTEPDIDGVGGKMYGYFVTEKDWTVLPIKGVDLTDAIAATMSYSVLGESPRTILFRLNGGAEHVYPIPALTDSAGGPRNGTRALTNDIPIGELVNGDNTIEFKLATPPSNTEYVANVDLDVQTSK